MLEKEIIADVGKGESLLMLEKDKIADVGKGDHCCCWKRR